MSKKAPQIYILVCFSFFLSGRDRAAVPPEAAHSNMIEAYIQPYVQSNNFSGTVVVCQRGKVTFQKSYGFADWDQKIPNTAETRFHIASMSMQFTAAALLQLVDQGQITLDTHVNDVVHGIAGGEKVTIRHLLTERSGIPDINEQPDYGEVLDQHQTPESLVAKIAGLPLLFEPGTKYMHEEHSAYNLLALVIEKKTGLPFAAALKSLVFDPLALTTIGVDDDLPFSSNMAKGYQPKGVEGIQAAQSIHWSAKTGNASIYSTAIDEARWVDALFNRRFLKPSSRDAVLETSQRVGYGWFKGINERFDEVAYYMNGRAPGFASFVLYLPREQLTVVVFSNIYSSATSTIGNDIAAISVDRSYGPFRPSEQPPSESELKASTGTFRFGPDFYQTNAQITLFLNGTEFAMRWPSGDISPLVPLSKDRFIDRSYWQEVRIERDAAGNPATLWYDRFQGKSDHSSGPGWILTWSDEFSQTDGSPPDPNKWQVEAGGNGWGNDELEYYTSRPQNLQVRSGNLEMTAVKERYMGPDGVTRGYTSARLKTMGKFEQAYGRFEAGIKIPYGQGIWPAFWMLGNDSETAGWPSCGEIGIMENIGREPAIVHGTIHGPGYFGANGIGSSYSLPAGRFTDEFHIYAVEWEPGQIRFYVDDHLYATRVPADLPAGTKWVYDHPFYVILDLAVGGGWPGNPDNSTVFPQKMLVDYVRAYKQSNH